MAKSSNTIILLAVELLLNIESAKPYASVHPSILQLILLITDIEADGYKKVFVEKAV